MCRAVCYINFPTVFRRVVNGDNDNRIRFNSFQTIWLRSPIYCNIRAEFGFSNKIIVMSSIPIKLMGKKFNHECQITNFWTGESLSWNPIQLPALVIRVPLFCMNTYQLWTYVYSISCVVYCVQCSSSKRTSCNNDFHSTHYLSIFSSKIFDEICVLKTVSNQAVMVIANSFRRVILLESWWDVHIFCNRKGKTNEFQFEFRIASLLSSQKFEFS